MVALAERLRLELDSSDRKNLVGSRITPDKSDYRTSGNFKGTFTLAPRCAPRHTTGSKSKTRPPVIPLDEQAHLVLCLARART